MPKIDRDLKLREVLYYISKQVTPDSRYSSPKIYAWTVEEIVVTKIGSKYVWFGADLRIERRGDRRFWSPSFGNEWHVDNSITDVFDSESEAKKEIERQESIEQISKEYQVRDFLQKLSMPTLETIAREIV